jgi:hypothetical protein
MDLKVQARPCPPGRRVRGPCFVIWSRCWSTGRRSRNGQPARCPRPVDRSRGLNRYHSLRVGDEVDTVRKAPRRQQRHPDTAPIGDAREPMVELDAARRVEVGEHLLGTDLLGKRDRIRERRSVPRSGSPPQCPWRSSIRLPAYSRPSVLSRSSSRSHKPRRTGSCTGCTRSRSSSFLPPRPSRLRSRRTRLPDPRGHRAPRRWSVHRPRSGHMARQARPTARTAPTP